MRISMASTRKGRGILFVLILVTVSLFYILHFLRREKNDHIYVRDIEINSSHFTGNIKDDSSRAKPRNDAVEQKTGNADEHSDQDISEARSINPVTIPSNPTKGERAVSSSKNKLRGRILRGEEPANGVVLSVYDISAETDASGAFSLPFSRKGQFLKISPDPSDRFNVPFTLRRTRFPERLDIKLHTGVIHGVTDLAFSTPDEKREKKIRIFLSEYHTKTLKPDGRPWFTDMAGNVYEAHIDMDQRYTVCVGETYRFENLIPGIYTVSAECKRYAFKKTKVMLDDQVMRVDITMVPAGSVKVVLEKSIKFYREEDVYVEFWKWEDKILYRGLEGMKKRVVLGDDFLPGDYAVRLYEYGDPGTLLAEKDKITVSPWTTMEIIFSDKDKPEDSEIK